MYLMTTSVGMKSKQAMKPLYTWDEDSTYIQNPPFFEGLSPEPGEVEPLTWTYVLLVNLVIL